MKRELIADLRGEIFPRFATDVLAFADRVGARLQHIYDELAQAIARAMLERRDADVGSIERALAAPRDDRAERPNRTRASPRELARELLAVRELVESFVEREEGRAGRSRSRSGAPLPRRSIVRSVDLRSRPAAVALARRRCSVRSAAGNQSDQRLRRSRRC